MRHRVPLTARQHVLPVPSGGAGHPLAAGPPGALGQLGEARRQRVEEMGREPIPGRPAQSGAEWHPQAGRTEVRTGWRQIDSQVVEQ